MAQQTITNNINIVINTTVININGSLKQNDETNLHGKTFRLQSNNGNYLCNELYHTSRGNDKRDKLSNYPFVCGVSGCAATFTFLKQSNNLYLIQITNGNGYTQKNRYLSAENWYNTDRMKEGIRLQSNHFIGCAAQFAIKKVSGNYYSITVKGGNTHTSIGGSVCISQKVRVRARDGYYLVTKHTNAPTLWKLV
eukprot:430179_1